MPHAPVFGTIGSANYSMELMMDPLQTAQIRLLELKVEELEDSLRNSITSLEVTMAYIKAIAPYLPDKARLRGDTAIRQLGEG